MTAKEFQRRFHSLDAIAVQTLWRLYSRTRDVDGARADIVASLARLEDQAEQQSFMARRESRTDSADSASLTAVP